MSPARIALPVPTSSLSDEADAYVASLDIVIEGDTDVLTTGGTAFEELMLALQLRHLSFHPRTRAFIDNSMKADALDGRIDRNWSSIDSMDAGEGRVVDLANRIQALARASDTISWRQINR